MTGPRTKADAIAALYAQVGAPGWARVNLDALADVLRDLSWRPPGPVPIDVPDLAELPDEDRDALLRTLARVAVETIDAPRPIRLVHAE
jgi:hypothetical protein